MSLLITLTIRTSDSHVTTLCDDKVTWERKKLGTTSRQRNTKRERERQRNALHIQLLSCDLRSLSLENQYIAKVDLSLLLYEILISRIALNTLYYWSNHWGKSDKNNTFIIKIIMNYLQMNIEIVVKLLIFRKSIWNIDNQNYLPGIIATVLSARKTRNVRRAARFPKSTPIVM